MEAAARIQDAIASILLPQRSIYAELDNPSDPPLDSIPLASPSATESPSVNTTNPVVANEPHNGTTSYHLDAPAVEDPFSSVSPSVFSPAPIAGAQRPLPAVEEHNGGSSRLSVMMSTRDAGLTGNSNSLNDSKSPFNDEPTDSIYVPSQSYRSNTSSSQSPPSSPPSRRHSGIGRMSYITGHSVPRSYNQDMNHGRSIMDLLGGTQYGPASTDVFERAERALAVEEQRDRIRADLGAGRGRRNQFDDIESKNLMASLPLPPSAMSPHAPSLRLGPSVAEEEEPEEEDEDDAPPDFTSRVPLMSTHGVRSRANRQINISSPTSPRRAYAWDGLSLGGGPTGGILGIAQSSAGMNAKERALWRWVNVVDLDAFLQQVYMYYVGKGVWAIALSRLLNLLTVGWVIFFSTALIGCIDYSILWESHHLAEIVVPHCVNRFSGATLILVMSFSGFYFWRVIRFGLGVRKLWEMHEFYAELLEVPENDIQTIPWHVIVSRLAVLRESHPSSLSSNPSMNNSTIRSHARLDAHEVANRIMREENYLIALFNKEILDLSIPLLDIIHRAFPKSTSLGSEMLTKSLEWNLSFCLIGFLFGKDGQVRKAFLTERNKVELTETLRRRFILMGCINAVFAPFIILYLLMYSFFRYFEEYHKNPSSIGSRQFTQLARWKFREFNELPHLFQQRLNRAHPVAEQYVNQFPKEKTALLSRFVAFLAGSFAAVLILFSLIDPDAFLHFEITPGRTVLFYIGIFGTVLAVARGMVPDDVNVMLPEDLMREVVEHTHYLPVEWRRQLHSAEVHTAFGGLFQMKIALFFREVLSVLFTPLVLWYSLPACAGPIVDFFREFTVHVDGLGYVCSFAVFDFKRHGDIKFGAPVHVENDYWKSKEGKMEKSFLNFTASNPAWIPRDQTQSLFLSKLTEVGHAPQGAMHSSQANPYPRFQPQARSASRSNRFGVVAPFVSVLAEENGDQTQSIDREQAKLYDRAFLKSTSGSTLGLNGRPRAAGLPRQPPRQTRPTEEAIDEESGLDGDSYVATTESQPFGGMEEQGSVGEMPNTTNGKADLTGILGEMYDISGKRW